MKKFTTIVALAIIVCLFAVVALIGPFRILGESMMWFSEDTEYSTEFSEHAFLGVQEGDSEQRVLELLGEPLKSIETEPYLQWLYAPRFHDGFAAGGHYPDMRYSYTAIRFNESGMFQEAFGQIAGRTSINLLGASSTAYLGDGSNTLGISDVKIDELNNRQATTVQIEIEFGKPSQIFQSDVVKWLQYSRSPGSRNYRKRSIGLDKDGNVSRIVRDYYWD